MKQVLTDLIARPPGQVILLIGQDNILRDFVVSECLFIICICTENESSVVC